MVYNWIKSIQSRLFVPVCVLCKGPGTADRDLCEDCLQELPTNTRACQRCALPLPPGAETLCGECQRDSPAYHAAVAPFQYAPPLDHLILGLKFQGKLQLSRLLGELMADHLARRADSRPELIVPVPLHPSRLRERGFNQALELARPIARRLGIALDYRCCERIRATAAQSQLRGKERRTNVKGAFRMIAPIAARHVAIVDDVVTTGHTVDELARVLVKSGVEKVEVWACARAVK